VYHAEENEVEKNIQAVPELKNTLNILRLRELGEKILDQVEDLYQKKQKLEYLYLNGKDVLEENLVFELMQKLAEIFAPTISEIKKHSPFEEELSLKSEDESGNRSEIYLKKSVVKDKLYEIKEKGRKLFDILLS
jgi:predicted RNA-binding protein with EMAP domain